MVKVHASETLGRVVDRACRSLEAWASARAADRALTATRASSIFDGTSEILRTVIAKSVLSKGPVLFDLNR
jgi:acyl-CoA dehydrogenase